MDSATDMDFWGGYVLPGVIIVLQIVAIIAPLMICVAYLTLAERKVIASLQLRKGPNVVGPFGLLQPLADGLKLLTKETIIPTGANRFLFILAPMLTFILAMVAWAVIPVDAGWVLALRAAVDEILAASARSATSTLCIL